MPRTILIAAGLMTCLCAANAVAGDVTYLGRGSGPDVARVEDSSHRTREIRKGDVLGELGEVKDIDDDEIVFEKELSDTERENLKSLGLAAPDLRRFHLMRRDGSHASATRLGSAAFSTE